MESAASFEARVKARTGLGLGDLPAAAAEELLGGPLYARRGAVVGCAVGYPDREDETGAPVWGPSAFRRTVL